MTPSEGLRVLACATRMLNPGAPIPENRDDAEHELMFLGFASMLDPPRPEVSDAVAQCHAPGSASLS